MTPAPSVDKALLEVVAHYSIAMRDLYGTVRNRVSEEARRVAVIVLAEWCELPWAAVAREMGRDVKTVYEWRQAMTEDDYAEARRIVEKLGNG